MKMNNKDELLKLANRVKKLRIEKGANQEIAYIHTRILEE